MELLKLKLSEIEESTTNPRKDFDKADLAVLAESIKAAGLLVPIIVRRKGKGYVIVAGARRFRAHQLAELQEIDALLMEADDATAEEAQLIENDDGKRIPLSPLEKAEGYAGFMARHKINVDELALRLKVSRSNVYATVRLLKLHPDAKKALKEGVLKESTAKVLAQVRGPASRQASATKDVLQGRWGNGPMSVREAVDHLSREYFLDLRKALFDTKDAELDKEAGSCTSCEKRTGAQPELPLEDGAKLEPDQCTDAPCWAKKTKLQAAANAAKLGVELLDEKEAAKLFNQWGDLQGTTHVMASRPHPGSSTGQDYGALLTPEQKKSLMVIAVDPKGGIVELLKNDGLTKAIEETGRLKKRKATKSSSSSGTRSTPATKKLTPEEQAKADFNEAVKKKLNGALIAALIAAVEKEGFSKKGLSRLARLVLGSSEGINLERRGIKEDAWGAARTEKTFAKVFGKYSPVQLLGLIYEASLGYDLGDFLDGFDGGTYDEAFKDFGVDRKKVEAAVRAATPAPAVIKAPTPIAAKKPVKAKAKKAAKPTKKKAA